MYLGVDPLPQNLGPVSKLLLQDHTNGQGYSPYSIRAAQIQLDAAIVLICERFHLEDPVAFRAFLRLVGGVVSGSYALMPFHDLSFLPGDLDIYVPAISGNIVPYYLGDHGYLRVFGPDVYSSHNNCISTVHRYRRGFTTIDIVYSRTNCAAQVIPEFHSTLVMNYISYAGVVCMYPGPTLAGVGIMNALSRPANICRAKYEARGFKFIKCVPGGNEHGPTGHSCRTEYHCPSTIRSINDSSVLFVPFEGYSSPLSLHQNNICWRLNNNTCGERVWGFTVGTTGQFVPASRSPVFL